METQWFKSRAREQGVTTEQLAKAIGRDRAVVSRILNGRQPMSPTYAETFAELLGVPVETIVEKAQIFTAKSRRREDFEGDVVPLEMPDADNSPDATIANSLSPKSGRETWRVTSNVLQLMGYLKNDAILVDTEKFDIKAGDAVLGLVYDPGVGQPRTVLRVFRPPALISASPDPSDALFDIVDGERVSIVGRVVAQWRLLDAR